VGTENVVASAFAADGFGFANANIDIKCSVNVGGLIAPNPSGTAGPFNNVIEPSINLVAYDDRALVAEANRALVADERWTRKGSGGEELTLAERDCSAA